MRHHTTDPTKRAEHIADRESKLLEQERARRGVMPYTDWPRYWLDIFYEARQELCGENQPCKN